MKSVAKFFSFVFHPIFLPSFATILLFILPTYLSNFQYVYKKGITQIVFLSTFITPLLIILILVNTRVISDFYLTEKKERFYPFSIVSFIYILTYFILKNLPLGVLKVPTYINNFILLSALTIFVILIVNLKIKASAHMAGMGMFLSFFLIFFNNEGIGKIIFDFSSYSITTIYFFSVIILLSGIVASSRLILKAHTLKEILIGLFVGLFVGLLSVFFA